MLTKLVNIIEKTELDASTVSLRNDGIIQLDMREIEREVSLEDVKAITSALKKLGNGKRFPVLILVKRFNPISKEASEYSASEEAGIYTIADAIVISNFAIRIASNFYIKMFKPVRPTKMFGSEEKAVEWLKTLLE